MPNLTSDQKDQVSIIIPTYNEGETIGLLLNEITRKVGEVIETEVIVVDAGSSDATYIIAEESGAKTIKQTTNTGYGDAIKVGLKNASFPNIVIFDARGTYDPQYIINGLRFIFEDKADMVIITGELLSLMERVGSALVTLSIKVNFNLKISDPQPTFVCLRKKVLNNLNLLSNDNNLTTELMLKAHSRGYRIKELIVKPRRRLSTTFRPIRNLRNAFSCYYTIIKSSFELIKTEEK